MSTRKTPLPPMDMDPAQHALYEKIAGGERATESAFALVDDHGALAGPFDAMLLAPALGDALQALGAAIRFQGMLSDRAREMAILAVAHHQHSDFEVFAHEAVGRRIGLTGQDLADLAAGRVPSSADEVETAAFTMANRLLRDADLDDSAYQEAVQVLGEAGVFEVNTIVGYYRLLATQLKVFGR